MVELRKKFTVRLESGPLVEAWLVGAYEIVDSEGRPKGEKYLIFQGCLGGMIYFKDARDFEKEERKAPPTVPSLK